MKLAALLSGGKDSIYSAYLAQKAGHEITCFITIVSENKESYMFHTPSIEKTKKQARAMRIPLIIQTTKGKKEDELKDLEKAIKKARKDFGVQGVITGAIESVYQASRIERITNKLKLECFNPLWQKDEFEYLDEIVKEKFKTILIGVYAYPFDKHWLGKEIDKKFIKEITAFNEKYKIHPAGEGGEFETFVLDCPMFKEPLEVIDEKITTTGENSWTMEIEVK